GITAARPRLRETILQLAHERVGVVAQENGAHALIAACDQDRAERACADGEADRGRGLAAIARRLHGRDLAVGRVGQGGHGRRPFVNSSLLRSHVAVAAPLHTPGLALTSTNFLSPVPRFRRSSPTCAIDILELSSRESPAPT